MISMTSCGAPGFGGGPTSFWQNGETNPLRGTSRLAPEDRGAKPSHCRETKPPRRCRNRAREFGRTISGENANGISGGLRGEATGAVQQPAGAADHRGARMLIIPSYDCRQMTASAFWRNGETNSLENSQLNQFLARRDTGTQRNQTVALTPPAGSSNPGSPSPIARSRPSSWRQTGRACRFPRCSR